MALWGNKDLVYSDGTVQVNLTTGEVTGTTGVVSFTDGGVTAGNVITVGAGATYGYAIVTGVTSTTLSIASTEGFVSGLTTVPSTTYEISGEPLYTVLDSHYRAPETKTTGFSTNPVFTSVFGVDRIETGIAATTAYAVAHQGWVGITTYTDCHGVSRVKSETLVAIGILTTSDADDDTRFPDS
jgi:hypothetical protein